jgi:hypothetical protein
MDPSELRVHLGLTHMSRILAHRRDAETGPHSLCPLCVLRF